MARVGAAVPSQLRPGRTPPAATFAQLTSVSRWPSARPSTSHTYLQPPAAAHGRPGPGPIGLAEDAAAACCRLLTSARRERRARRSAGQSSAESSMGGARRGGWEEGSRPAREREVSRGRGRWTPACLGFRGTQLSEWTRGIHVHLNKDCLFSHSYDACNRSESRLCCRKPLGFQSCL
ncbi:uncharacterized protein LOC144329485 [Macaca mulatta]